MTELKESTEYKQTEKNPHSMGQKIVQSIVSDKFALLGLVMSTGFILVSALAPIISPYNPEERFDPFVEPGGYSTPGQNQETLHLLGTTSFGHDMLSVIIYGARISLIVAVGTVLFSFIIGSAIGLIAGYYGGKVDSVLMRSMDILWTFPTLVIAIGVIAFSGSLGTHNVIIAIGIAYIDDFARLIRGEVLIIREKPYIMAARSLGMSDVRIMFKEIFPNSIAPLIVQATLLIPLAIIIESVLSFLGLGVQPTTPTWGQLIGEGREFLGIAWWITIIPGFAIMISVLAFNMLGDGIRDALDVTNNEVTSK